jgi:hypothetical protein
MICYLLKGQNGMPTLEQLDEQWSDMSKEFQRRQMASIDCLKGLYRSGGPIVSEERYAECERLRQEAEKYREQMREFAKANFGG